MLKKREKKYIRHKRVRAKIKGTAKVPRLCVFRSLNHIYAQVINDDEGKTIISADSREISKKTSSKNLSAQAGKKYPGKLEKAYQVGKLIAKKSQEKKIEKIVFDRGGYKYHGRIKALAEGAREGGLKF